MVSSTTQQRTAALSSTKRRLSSTAGATGMCCAGMPSWGRRARGPATPCALQAL